MAANVPLVEPQYTVPACTAGEVQTGPPVSAVHCSRPAVPSTAYTFPSSHPNSTRLPEREGVESIAAAAWNVHRCLPVRLSRA